jgi:hypothetical protein
VTIRTYKIAFSDLLQHETDGGTVEVPARNIEKLCFSWAVVEVHHIGRIVLPAISTRTRFCRAENRTTTCLSRQRPSDEFASILSIVLLFIRLMARPAITLRSPLRPWTKLIDGFVRSTTSTPPQCQLIHVASLFGMAKLAAGIEPATSALQKRCSAWLSYASGPPVIAERVSIGRRHKCCKSKFPCAYTPFAGVSSRAPPLSVGHVRIPKSSSYSQGETAAPRRIYTGSPRRGKRRSDAFPSRMSGAGDAACSIPSFFASLFPSLGI